MRGRRRAAEIAVLAEREAVVAEDEDDRVVGHLIQQLAELVVDRLHVVDVRLAHAVDVVVGEVELHHPPVRRAEAVVLRPARAHVERRGGEGVRRVEGVHADEERAGALDLAQRPDPRGASCGASPR